MDDEYRKADTENLVPEDMLVRDTRRIALCVAACDGVDEAMLELLAQRDKQGITNMQTILNRITWTGLPTI